MSFRVESETPLVIGQFIDILGNAWDSSGVNGPPFGVVRSVVSHYTANGKVTFSATCDTVSYGVWTNEASEVSMPTVSPAPPRYSKAEHESIERKLLEELTMLSCNGACSLTIDTSEGFENMRITHMPDRWNGKIDNAVLTTYDLPTQVSDLITYIFPKLLEDHKRRTRNARVYQPVPPIALRNAGYETIRSEYEEKYGAFESALRFESGGVRSTPSSPGITTSASFW